MHETNMAGPIVILMVDDDPADIRLIKEALKTKERRMDMHTVSNGIDAMAFLRREGTYAEMPRPDIILLDLNIPRMNGFETLQAIKNDSSFKRIPVITLSTSTVREDLLRAYDLHANCYIAKPVEWRKFVDVIESIEKFWLTIVKLPKG